MKFDFAVLGATGEEGSIASRDLIHSGYSVLMCGRNPARIKQLLKNKKAKFAPVDLTNINATAKTIKESGAKIVLNCAELRLNLLAMKACILAKAHYLDLGGLQEMTVQQYKLDKELRKRNLIALLGCGSTPGISNVMAAFAVNQMDTVERIDLGFAWNSTPKQFILPYSFESIVYEITTPSVIMKDGKLMKSRVCEFSGVKNFMKIGEQKTYCIVHSEVFTFYRYFKKKGLKEVHYWAGFPEHSFKVLELLIELGFSSDKPIKIGGTEIRPVDFSREVLKNVKKPDDYKEVEDVWVKVIGEKNGERRIIEIGCLVESLKGWEDYASNVDTGMTISIMAQMIFQGIISEDYIGVTAPEVVVPPKPFFHELLKRGMKIYIDKKEFI